MQAILVDKNFPAEVPAFCNQGVYITTGRPVKVDPGHLSSDLFFRYFLAHNIADNNSSWHIPARNIVDVYRIIEWKNGKIRLAPVSADPERPAKMKVETFGSIPRICRKCVGWIAFQLLGIASFKILK